MLTNGFLLIWIIGIYSQPKKQHLVNKMANSNYRAIWQGTGKESHKNYEQIAKIIGDDGKYLTIKFDDGTKMTSVPYTDARLC